MNTDKNFGKDAAKAGLIIGLLLFAITSVQALSNTDSVSWIGLIALIGCIYYFGKKRADKRGDLGNTFVDALKFTFTTMFYAGIIGGLGDYLLHNYIAIEYYEEIQAQSMIIVESLFSSDTSEFDEAAEMMLGLFQSPIFMVINGIFGMIVRGSIVGLFVAPFLKRDVNIFIEKNEE